MLKGLLWVLTVLPMVLFAESDFEREQIIQRIQPIGQVKVQENEAFVSKEVEPIAQTKTPKKALGQEIYDQYCQVCHQNGVAGAPKFRNEEDWQERVVKLGIDGLVVQAIKGLNAMPAKGTCMSCSKKDIKAAIEYMVPPL